MTIATIVTRGFGTFGDIAHIVTQGYDIGQASPITTDYHDGESDRRHSKERDKRHEDFRQAREDLRTQIAEAFSIATGEATIPEPAEVAKLERKAFQMPKAQRPAYRRQFMQIKNWQAELAEVDRILLAMDDEDMADILVLL